MVDVFTQKSDLNIAVHEIRRNTGVGLTVSVTATATLDAGCN